MSYAELSIEFPYLSNLGVGLEALRDYKLTAYHTLPWCFDKLEFKYH